MERINDNTPVIPLPNPGEGGPVYDGNSGNTPVIPLPNPGEGGPVYDGSTGNIPVIPLPNPGEGGPVNGGSSVRPPIWLPLSRVRFLNAAFGYTTHRDICYYTFHRFFNDTATTEIYTLSLHDALPI
mgnify:CR=1 FL=1